MSTDRAFGLEKGKVYPYQDARALLNPLRRLILPPDDLVRWMKVRAEDTVLELGCGPGYLSPALAWAVSAGTVVLFDLQREMLRLAADRVPSIGVCRLVQGDAVALPFTTNSFDKVLMVTVLGETGDPVSCLREIHRVLKPGGHLVNVEQRGDSDRIVPQEIARLAAEAGFTLGRQRSFGLGFSRAVELVASAGAP